MPEPVRFVNRRTGKIEEEKIYGEKALRWTYETGLGRVALRLLVSRRFFSLWYGHRMSRPASRKLVLPFIRDYGLDPAEFAESPDHFATFNEFFYRKLKPSARPVDGSETSVVFPADGRHFVIPRLGDETRVFAKGQRFDLRGLLGDAANEFTGGSLLVSRLCPVDYHRFHFPCAGIPGAFKSLDGPLFSVSPIALRENLSWLWENHRHLTMLESPRVGKVAIIEIGATCVGSIRQTYQPGAAVAKGDEKGYFAFGGSCVITIFQPGRVRFDSDLVSASAEGLETHAFMGEHLGEADETESSQPVAGG
ncbi:MAG: phosphatidylserine decarboxylase [Verrucomicrobiales bacterium]